jgi:hypothetical protein
MAVAGMFLGGALVQGWNLAATSAGVPTGGKIAILLGFAILFAASLLIRERE